LNTHCEDTIALIPAANIEDLVSTLILPSSVIQAISIKIPDKERAKWHLLIADFEGASEEGLSSLVVGGRRGDRTGWLMGLSLFGNGFRLPLSPVARSSRFRSLVSFLLRTMLDNVMVMPSSKGEAQQT
jgi:hypothetical protein